MTVTRRTELLQPPESLKGLKEGKVPTHRTLSKLALPAYDAYANINLTECLCIHHPISPRVLLLTRELTSP